MFWSREITFWFGQTNYSETKEWFNITTIWLCAGAVPMAQKKDKSYALHLYYRILV